MTISFIDDWWAKPETPTESMPSKKTTKYRFLTANNKWFMGIKKAMAAVKAGSSNPVEDLDKLHKFLAQFRNFSQSNKSTWLDGEEFLPEGWRYRTCQATTGDYAKVLSPGGEVFPSRSRALAHMVQEGAPPQQLEKMRNSLIFDGWMGSSLLPPGWMYRKCKSGRNEHSFLSPSGAMFPSRRLLVAHLREQPGFTEEDITNLDLLRKDIRARWISSTNDWLEEDPSVPRGWRIRYFDLEGRRYGKPRHFILSPEGALFQTRRAALLALVQRGASEEVVGSMLLLLHHEGWEEHPALPAGWRFRQRENKAVSLLSRKGEELGLARAAQYLEASQEYSRGDREKLVAFAWEVQQEKVERKTSGWVEDPSLPSGWGVRTGLRFRGVQQLVSPGGEEVRRGGRGRRGGDSGSGGGGAGAAGH